MDTSELAIPGAKSSSLTLIVEYMEHHQGTEPPIIEKPLRSKFMKDVCKVYIFSFLLMIVTIFFVQDKCDATWIDAIGEDRQKLYDLILVKKISIFFVFICYFFFCRLLTTWMSNLYFT